MTVNAQDTKATVKSGRPQVLGIPWPDDEAAVKKEPAGELYVRGDFAESSRAACRSP